MLSLTGRRSIALRNLCLVSISVLSLSLKEFLALNDILDNTKIVHTREIKILEDIIFYMLYINNTLKYY